MPSNDALHARVTAALGTIQHPRDGQDVVTAGAIQQLAVDDAGAVSFTFRLTREDPGTLVRDARKAVQQVEGVTAVKITVVDPGARPGA
ncbi:MAG: iron-sulfur cluster assembly protein, partial [Gemmatimonadales bacterium]